MVNKTGFKTDFILVLLAYTAIWSSKQTGIKFKSEYSSDIDNARIDI